MAKKEFAKDNEKKVPFAALRKGALCALIGTTAIAGGLLVGCDEGSVAGPAGVNFYYGAEDPTTDLNGKVGDFYIETDDGDVWQLGADGWEVISNIKGPTGAKGNKGDKGDTGATGAKGDKGDTGEKGDPGEQGVSVTNVSVVPGFDLDGNMYMDMTFHYSNDTTTTDRVYPNQTIYVGQEMTLQEAVNEIAVGGTIVLKNDIVLDKVVTVNRQAKIDLAGHTISNTEELWNDTEEIDDWSLISVREGGDLTITDSGRMEEIFDEQGGFASSEYVNGAMYALEGDCYAIDVQDGAKCTINGGEYVGNISAVYVHTGELVVNDGSFGIQQLDPKTKDERYTLNCFNENYKNGTAKITVNGGYFVNFDPANAGDDGNYVSQGNTVVSAEMDGEMYYYVCPIEEAIEMLPSMDGTPVYVTMVDDITFPELGMVIGEGVDLTINLNGYTISAPNDEVGDGVFHVLAGGKLTIEGEGTIDGECANKEGYKMAIWADGGEVVINGGTFTNSSTDGTATQYDMIYAKNGGIITINGGTFKGYNPAESDTENPVANFVAEGYAVVAETVDEEVWYTVVDLQEFIEEAEAGATITLASDVVLDAQLNISKQITLDLNGKTISNTEDVWDTDNKKWSLISVAGGNLTIKNGTLQAKSGDCYAIDVRNGGNLVIESGKYVGNVHSIYVHTGSATINGGEFDIQQLSQLTGDSRYTLNCLDANYKNGTATITVTGGKFANYNPEGSTSEYPTANFLAEGYTVEASQPDVVTGDIWYTVVEKIAE